ncbi:MAG: CheR family methyltransferase, partial [Planctomycetota bacterium]
DEDVRKAVRFRSENILDARYQDLDLVLCRNVMIYFDQASIERMVGVLARSLREDGVLVVGDSEYLACETAELARERLGRTTVYRKRKAGRRG